ncbi:hypothetical protein AAE478_004958, partial [Parahypoxylon ruwenzoriense]
MLRCGYYNERGLFIAVDASTSGLSATTIFATLPATDDNAPSGTPTQGNTATTTETPADQPKEGLWTSDKITLGTALGVGLPATIAGVLAAWYAYRSLRKKKQDSQLDSE